MGFLCYLMEHKWFFLFNINTEYDAGTGVYQCKRCKEISIGAAQR